MRRLLLSSALALSLLGCLEPDKPYLAAMDSTAPTVLRSKPAKVTGGDSVVATDPLTVVFSEEMDLRSLRPGISVRKDNQDVPIDIVVNGDGGVANNSTTDFQDLDKPYPVAIRRTDGAAWESGVSYTLRLSPLLIDLQGNPIAAQIDLPFTAQ